MPIAVLDGTEAEFLADLGAIHQDIMFVMNCCRRMLEMLPHDDHDGVVFQALFTAALITYARCFNGGHRSGLQVKDVTKLGLEGDPRGFHEQIMAMRSKHVAHSVNPFEMVTVGAILSPIDAELRRVEGIGTLTARHVSFDADGIRQLGVLCARLLDKVIKERAERLQGILLEQARLIDIEDLYQRPAPRAQPPGPEAASQHRLRQRGPQTDASSG